jgi:hypothetical protein
MRTATKKIIAGLSLLACLLAIVTGVTQGVPFVAVVERAIGATVVFGLLGFLGGLVYEKLWLR